MMNRIDMSSLDVAVYFPPEELGRLDPYEFTDNGGAYLAWKLYEPLVYADNKGRVTGGLAETFGASRDHRTYTFMLRREVRFHEGTPFDASCVVAAWQRARKQETEAWRGVGWVEEVDPYTVTVVLEAPSDTFLQDEASFWPVTKESDAGGLLGTGPYKLDSSGGQVALVANEEHWDPTPAPLQKANIYQIDPGDRQTAIANGALLLDFDEEEAANAPVYQTPWGQAARDFIVCGSCKGGKVKGKKPFPRPRPKWPVDA
jgi:ABC-type transport system substrate-binding protein